MLKDSRSISRELERSGFQHVSTRGSHRTCWHPESRLIVIVPHPRRDLPVGTVRSMYEQAGWRGRDAP